MNNTAEKQDRKRQYAAQLIVVLFVLVVCAVCWFVGPSQARWVVQRAAVDIRQNEAGDYFYVQKKNRIAVDKLVAEQDSALLEFARRTAAPAVVEPPSVEPPVEREFIVLATSDPENSAQRYELVTAARHFGLLSLMPAVVAIGLCLITREPISAIFAGICTGSFLLGHWDVLDTVLIPGLATKDAVGLMVLYLFLLGGLLGIWTKTGAAAAFASRASERFVRGPRSAKLTAWILGVFFFQGGSISAVLTGTAVRPMSDKHRVSHEELSCLVDATASPIAVLIPFNAWPAYVQALIFVPGVTFLATEADRTLFYFQSLPLGFLSLFVVLGALLLSLDRLPLLGTRMKQAVLRVRETGALDAETAVPLAEQEDRPEVIPKGYQPRAAEFIAPLLVMVVVAIGSFLYGNLDIQLAFAAALVLAIATAVVRGMTIRDVATGIVEGMQGALIAMLLLLLAVVLGGISRNCGGGLFLVELLGNDLPYWAVPVALQLIAMAVSFSLGTSWGTFAIVLPLAMPFSWAVGMPLEHTQLYMMVCFAAVLHGGVFGDFASPISDTSILSAMTSGADLMDHVRTQLPFALAAALLAAICWTLVVVLFV